MGKLRDVKKGDIYYMGKPSINIYDEGQLKDIGLGELPNVGDIFTINGKVKVASVSESNMHNAKKTKSVSLEIEELDVEKKKSNKEVASGLYKES